MCRGRSQLLFLLVLAMVAALLAEARADLSATEWAKIAERAEGAAKRGDAREALDALTAAAKDDSERAVKLVASVLAKFPADSEEAADAAAQALALMRGEGALAELRKQVLGAAKDARFRTLGVDALGTRGGKREIETLKAALADKDEPVVRAAAIQLGRFRTEAAVLALASGMEALEAKKKTAGTWQDMKNALVRALGVDLAGGADYRNWYEANKARFVEGRGIPPEEKARPERTEREKPKEGRVGETVVFGTTLACRNVVIVLDRSGSMVVPDPYPSGEEPTTAPREYVETSGMKDPDRVRMTRAKKELVKLLEQLSKMKGKVNIIAYSTDVDCWKPAGLHDLSGGALESAKKFVENLTPEGVTATDSALEMAVEIAPTAECIYLISDGKATQDGKVYIPASVIVKRVEVLNRPRKVQVSTFGFVPAGGKGDSADVPLMQGLAEATGGVFTEIR